MKKEMAKILWLPIVFGILFGLFMLFFQNRVLAYLFEQNMDSLKEYLYQYKKLKLMEEVNMIKVTLNDFNSLKPEVKKFVLNKLNRVNDEVEYFFVYKLDKNFSKATAIVIPDIGIRKVGMVIDLNDDKNRIWKNLINKLKKSSTYSLFEEYKFKNPETGQNDEKFSYFTLDLKNNLLIGKGLYLSELNGIIDNVRFYQLEKLSKIVFYSFLIYSLFFTIFILILYFILKNILMKISIYEKHLEYDNRFLEERVKSQTGDLVKKYFYCGLTGLPNRNKLMEDLENIEAVIIIDIDDFGAVNDIYGSEFGNYVLKEFATFLNLYMSDAVVYRVGSDEFVIGYTTNVISLKSRVIELLNSLSFLVIKRGDLELDITVTIGSSDVKPVLETADIALRYAKKYKHNYIVYNQELNLKKVESNVLETIKKIKLAIKDDRIVPFFQCIKNRELEIVKYESLIRLIDENGKIISPYFFLDIAKKAKLYFELTYIMIEKTFKEFEHRKELVSINLSYQDIKNSVARKKIIDLIKNYRNSENVVIELLETEDLEDLGEVILFLDEVRKYGCKVAIDDFGSGYSNFSYLLKLNPDYIKIDGSITKYIAEDENARLIFSTIVNFVHKKDIKITAEFVANQEIYEVARELGADEFQGYYFCEPQQFI